MSIEQETGGRLDSDHTLASVRGGDGSFGAKLRQLRVRGGLTQEQLAERAGLSANAVSSLERGARQHPYPHTVGALVAALGLGGDERAELEATLRPRGATPRLPAMPSSMVGREAEIIDVVSRLRSPSARLLTLTGPGGVGKTRLALAVAHELLTGFRDGLVFVPLASVQDPNLVMPTIAENLGLRELGAQPLAGILRDFLRGRHMLLVVDNLEHLPDAAVLIAEQLSSAPRLRVLATSRGPLRVRDEQVFPVGPLTSDAASELFIERMRQAAVEPAEDDTAAIGQICLRLEHMPLAIELAAARTRVLPPWALLARLDPGLRILGSGPRDLPERQRTIQQTIGWSYGLLGLDEQAMLRGLAVFSGGWTLEAVAEVREQEVRTVLERHGHLVESSLVVPRRGGADPRFGMLETVRAYAMDQLTGSGEQDLMRDQHADFYQRLAAAAGTRVWAPAKAQTEVFEQLEAEHDNLHTAWHRLLDSSELDRLSEMVRALWPWWMIRGYLTEGLDWIAEVLNHPAPLSPGARGGDLSLEDASAGSGLPVTAALAMLALLGLGGLPQRQPLDQFRQFRAAHPGQRRLSEKRQPVRSRRDGVAVQEVTKRTGAGEAQHGGFDLEFAGGQ
ncbi:helix-turn-helix domain-containing protein [Nonomuraea sp. K274]|uniref:Helix-turn-helix domain-containing protein n=1 Tax=Nonomuraea cypriaca TaxID=1187855 RepID=A0A931EUA6_9ACTN|nr:helix-turn-helix domain-containing protein [Nonomuraea cypriaca]MBF8184309.1 helix-turn-helix domain-containing protein [Nonomuraea cypriaca]